jgi:hypothetical protein
VAGKYSFEITLLPKEEAKGESKEMKPAAK